MVTEAVCLPREVIKATARGQPSIVEIALSVASSISNTIKVQVVLVSCLGRKEYIMALSSHRLLTVHIRIHHMEGT